MAEMQTTLPIDLLKYDGKHVRVTDEFGNTFTGMAEYGNSDFLECEYGGEEDGIFVEDCLIYHSQIRSIEEIEVHGTVELWTENMILRRYRPEDAEELYEHFGTDPEMYKYSGWNPYATPEMARETTRRFIENYAEEHNYSWVMDVEDIVVGTIGAYDYESEQPGRHEQPNQREQPGRHAQIEVGFSVDRGWQGRGLATEALKKVLEYLTENEGIARVIAWCAAENIGSRRVMEKAGMKLVRTEKDGLTVGNTTYDKQIFEYRSRE